MRVDLIFDVTASAAFTPAQREWIGQQLSGRLVDGVLTIVAAEYRSQMRNRLPTRPSRAARERRLADKRRRTDTKPTGLRPFRPGRSRLVRMGRHRP